MDNFETLNFHNKATFVGDFYEEARRKSVGCLVHEMSSYIRSDVIDSTLLIEHCLLNVEQIVEVSDRLFHFKASIRVSPIGLYKISG